ncbi:MAG TPA: AAA family ATPase [Candidatus Limnocylindrales bacterium]
MLRRLRFDLRRNPAFLLAALALGAAAALILWELVPRSGVIVPAPAGGEPAFTYRSDWTFPELTRAADAGEVVAIGVATRDSALEVPGTSPAPADGLLVAKTRSGQDVVVVAGVPTTDAVDALKSLGYGRLLTQEAIDVTSGSSAPSGGSSSLAMLVTLLITAGLVAVILGVRRRSVVGERRQWSVGPAGSSVERPTVRLADVAGVDEAKLELVETIEFLRDPERFRAVGARPVRGVMLYGPPGTGKTMLAKAVAAEADVRFFAASGSDFVEKFVGVGAGRIRALFAAARKAGKGVIFIDEIDAIAKTRGGPMSHEEREQTLNQLLVELDGFGPNEDIVVIGATNRLETLDPAVLRPGRFTRKVHVPLPDNEDRADILAVHAADKPLSPAVDLVAIARKTYGFSGAMLADLLNEAAIFAARDARDVIGPEDVQKGWLKVAVGSSRIRSMDERERSIIAAHEGGHAVCGTLAGEKRRVEEISLYQHGEALGVTVSSSEDNALPSESDLRAQLVALMGGRVAEELLFDEYTGGASQDFAQATDLATRMVTKWGMGADPTARVRGVTGRGVLSAIAITDNAKPSVEVAAAQDRAVRAILDEAYARARSLLLGRMDLLDAVGGYLYERERMTGDEFEAIVDGRLRPSSTSDWRSPAASPRPWDEIPGLFASPVVPAAPAARHPGGERKVERRGRRTALPVLGAGRRRTLAERWIRRPLLGVLARAIRSLAGRSVGGGRPNAAA